MIVTSSVGELTVITSCAVPRLVSMTVCSRWSILCSITSRRFDRLIGLTESAFKKGTLLRSDKFGMCVFSCMVNKDTKSCLNTCACWSIESTVAFSVSTTCRKFGRHELLTDQSTTCNCVGMLKLVLRLFRLRIKLPKTDCCYLRTNCLTDLSAYKSRSL